MIIQDLERFLAVADNLSFTIAASKLFVTQPTLSSSIYGLEQELGFALFHRTTRNVSMTKEGEQFYYLAHSFVDSCNALRQKKTRPAGPERISVVHDRALNLPVLPFLLSLIRRANPQVTVKTVGKKNVDILPTLLSGGADVAVINSFSVPQKGVRSQLLFPYQLQILVSRSHPLAMWEQVPLRELADENFVIMDPSTSILSQLTLDICEAAQFEIKQSVYAANYRQLFLLTAEKEGISFCLSSDVEAFDYWGLSRVNVDITECFPLAEPAGLAVAWLASNSNPTIELVVESTKKFRALFQAPVAIADI